MRYGATYPYEPALALFNTQTDRVADASRGVMGVVAVDGTGVTPTCPAFEVAVG